MARRGIGLAWNKFHLNILFIVHDQVLVYGIAVQTG